MLTLKADKLKIYRKDRTSQAGNAYTTYSTKINSKDKDGNWQSVFITVRFKKGVEVNNKADIKVNNAFFGVDTYNGNSTLTMIITDFEVVADGVSADANAGSQVNVDTDFMNIPDGIAEELPFN